MISCLLSSEDPPVLSLREVTVGYAQRAVVHVANLDVAGGEVVAVLALSGVGKTTLLNAIAGTLPLIKGHVLIDGKELDNVARVHVVARTLQHFPLLHWLSVEGNLKVAARIRRLRRLNAYAALQRLHAGHLLKRFPRELSGGERCRVSLAQATVGISKLRVLLLDEPFGGLDSFVKADVARALFGLARDRSCAVLFVTHDIHDACEYANRAVVLSGASPAGISGELRVTSESAEELRALLQRGAPT